MIRRAVLVWLGVAFVITLCGMLRVLALDPAMSPLAAQAVSTAVSIAAVFGGAWLLVRSSPAPAFRDWRKAGLLWGFLTFGLETVMGRAWTGISWADMLDNYNLLAGHLWPLILLSTFVAPMVWGRRLHPSKSTGPISQPAA